MREDQRLGKYRGRRLRRRALSGDRGSPFQLDTIVPVIMGCAMLWWVSRGMTWTTGLVVSVVTLALIICILLFEHSSF